MAWAFYGVAGLYKWNQDHLRLEALNITAWDIVSNDYFCLQYSFSDCAAPFCFIYPVLGVLLVNADIQLHWVGPDAAFISLLCVAHAPRINQYCMAWELILFTPLKLLAMAILLLSLRRETGHLTGWVLKWPLLVMVGEHQWEIYSLHHLIILILDSSLSMKAYSWKETIIYSLGLLSIIIYLPMRLPMMMAELQQHVHRCMPKAQIQLV